jgi:antitoxin (DNA-binding transcriptional repressor) of toxin-antitoxin stability system
MQQIELAQAKQQLPQLLDEVIRGAEIVITENGQPLVKMSHAAMPKPRPQFGSARGLLTIPDDFDEPLEDFKEYME